MAKVLVSTLFAVLWLVAGADLLWEKNTAGWLIASADLVWEKNTVGWLQRTKWTINDLTRSDFISTQWTKPKMRYTRRTDEGEPPLNICGRLLADFTDMWWKWDDEKWDWRGWKDRVDGTGEVRDVCPPFGCCFPSLVKRKKLTSTIFDPSKKSTIFWMRTWFR